MFNLLWRINAFVFLTRTPATKTLTQRLNIKKLSVV